MTRDSRSATPAESSSKQTAAEKPGRQAIPGLALGYVALVTLAGVGLATGVLLTREISLPSLLLWAGMFFVGEAMWFRTPADRGTISMASTVHVAAVALIGLPELLAAGIVARWLVNALLLRQTWYKAAFNGGQISLSLFAAWMAHAWVSVHLSPSVAAAGPLAQVLPGIAAASVAYYFINTGLVCGVLAGMRRKSFFSTWRANFGYRGGILSSVALFLLAPIAVITIQGVGPLGMIILFVPMFFIRMNWERYITLQKTQKALIKTAKYAAKGEMAATVGNELNNYISTLSGNLEMLQADEGSLTPEQRDLRLESIAAQVHQMASLSQGLMDFSQLQSRFEATDVFALARETVDLLRYEKTFRDIHLVLDADPRGGTLLLDAQQIRKTLMEMLLNAANSLREAETPNPRISVGLWWHVPHQQLDLVIEDNGPGVPEDLDQKVFEPGFTTRDHGNGFGLSSVFRIVTNHGGTVAVENLPEGGARFLLRLPADGQARTEAA